MTTWLANTRDAVTTRLWPIPTLAVVGALVLGLALPELDAAISGHLSARVNGALFGGDADAARSLLDAIASSLITVTSLTFSLTVVTLQLASSQFSPRLLRTFTSDQFVQLTLALFLATFTYSLTVLRSVRSAGDSGQVEVVPRVAVTLAFVLTVASVVGLVLFLAHLAAQIRVETMLRTVHRGAARTMKIVLPEREHGTHARPFSPQPPVGATTLLARDDGFVTWIAEGDLLDIAVEAGVLIQLDVSPGDFLVKGTPVGRAWPASGGRLEQETADGVAEKIVSCIHVGFERTASQDVGYGLRQLVDVAIKALSPGINDPTTAVHALGHISALLCDLTDRDLRAQQLCDESGVVRVTLHGPDLAAYVDLGISQPRRYGASDPQVLEKILRVLLDLSHRVGPEQRTVVRDQLERLRGTVRAQSFDSFEVSALNGLGQQIEQNLTAPVADITSE